MSDCVFPVRPRFNHPVHDALVSNTRNLEGLREDREFLTQSRGWMVDSASWTRETIQYESQRLVREMAAGRVPETAYLGYLLGVAVLKGRHILVCERLLAGL